MKLFNSLSNQIEEFKPINKDRVGVYTCGPTVYDYLTIGNWRTYTLGDLLVRTLKHLGYTVDYVMNITDVGHLTGDNLGDADTGEDRMEKAVTREGKTAWEIAEFYASDFLQGYKRLNLSEPKIFCKATDHIHEQIEMVEQIEKVGFAYRINDGIYFDTVAFEKAGNKYGELSNSDQIKAGARVEPVAGKKNPRDFALWKFSPPSTGSGSMGRQMEWESPWGVGFPGWHIECSAMSTKYLGDQFDVHIGGEDLRSTHHPNEIAQAEAATGKKPFVKYWMHGAFLQVDGGRMGKSLGNAYTLSDVVERGFEPVALRYFYLTCHYRKQLNFTWEALESASKALEKLYDRSQVFGAYNQTRVSDRDPSDKVERKLKEFEEALVDDLKFPQALAALHAGLETVRDDFDVLYLLEKTDGVLGLGLIDEGKRRHVSFEKTRVRFKSLVEKRDTLREQKMFEKADEVKKEIESQGFVVRDTASGTMVVPKIKPVSVE